MVNRVELRTPVQAMQTFTEATPLASHFRQARCEEVGCAFHAKGWRIPVEEDTDRGRRQIALIKASGRRYTRQKDGPLAYYVFFAGQQCFRAHRRPMDRPALYLVRGGDWRGNTGVIRRHQRGDDWVEHMHEDTDRVVTRLQKG